MAESKAERTRQYIIDKAAPIFNKKGYAGTSLNDLIEATGLTKGAIYGNFENKDEIALEAFDYNLKAVNQPLANLIGAADNSIDKLLAMPHYYCKQYSKLAKRGGCAMLNASTEADDNHPLLKRKVASAIKNWKSKIEKIITTGIQNKEIKKGVDPDKISSTFIALIEGGIMMSKITGDQAHLDAAMEQFEKIVLNELKV